MEEYYQDTLSQDYNEIQSWYFIGKVVIIACYYYEDGKESERELTNVLHIQPPHHFPTMSRITVLSGSIQIDDLQTSQAYILNENEDCVIPALLVHEIQFLEDVEFEFELNSNDMIVYWDLEER